MNLSSNRIIGIDEDWDELLSLGIIEEVDSGEVFFTYITDGEKWGVKSLSNKPIVPIKYDSVKLEYGKFDDEFYIVCVYSGKYDIYHDDGTPVFLGLDKFEWNKFFFCRFFICLANSYKRGGRCIAGVEFDYKYNIQRHNNGNPRWIRPIADTLYGEIPNYLANNINLLSFVTLTDGFICPEKVHTENVRYSRMEVKTLTIPIDSSFLNQLVDKVHQSVFGNRGKAVSADIASRLDYSLMFIHVQNASAYIDENREKSKNRMKFDYYGTEYDFPITDPAFLDGFKKEPECYANIPDVYLTLSLGLEFEGWHHKLVAGVIIPTDASQTEYDDSVSYMEQQKRLHTNAYAKWTPEDDEQLKVLYRKGTSIQKLTQIFGRNEGAIYSRIGKLGLESKRGASQHTDENWFEKYDQELARLLDKRNEIDEQINEVRAKILEQMESHGVEKIHSEQFSVSYTPAKTVMQFDSKAFRAENELLYINYCKPKQREASIVVKRNVKD